MTAQESWKRRQVIAGLLAAVPAMRAAAEPAGRDGSVARDAAATRTLRGQVVWLSEAIRRRYGIQEVAEAAERLLALEAADGNFFPLVEDVRGRAFRRDPRLRQTEVELQVRQYPGMPLVQVLHVHQITPAGKFVVDYWCEICAITMYELKECECCQGPIELRLRRVTDLP